MKKTTSNNNSKEQIAAKVKGMTDFEMSRWFALVDAVNMVADMAEQRNVDFSKLDIKPSAIEHYIEATCDIYCKKLQEENNKLKHNAALKVATNIIGSIKTPELTLCPQ